MTFARHLAATRSVAVHVSRDTRGLAALLIAGALVCTPAARGEERRGEIASRGRSALFADLDRALAAMEQSGADLSEEQLRSSGHDAKRRERARDPESGRGDALRRAIDALSQQDAARRMEFTAAAARTLPPKARERLEKAKQAYEAGQGRLLRILRKIPEHAAGDAPETLTSLREAREIVQRLEDASRQDPISSEPRIRAPRITAPALPAGSPREDTTTPPDSFEDPLRSPGHGTRARRDGAPVAIGAIPKVLQDAANALASPVDVHEWVRNNIRPEFYHGRMKGEVQTYLEGSGNDADTAAVLIAMLRAKGIPARYVRGTIEVTGPTLAALAGTASPEQAVRVLERAGIPHEVVTGAGGIATVKLARVWVEAYVPYVNYRGALLDTQGKFWIPLDAGFKRLENPRGVDVVRDFGFGPRATLDAYLAQPQDATPLAYTRTRVTELLAQQNLTYEAALNRRNHLGENLGILASTLPYRVVAKTDVAYDLDPALGHGLRVVGEAPDGGTIIDATVPTADILGRRLTLAYVPATAEDEEVARSYGGIARTPPYLIEVTPVLKSGGVALARGDGAIGMAVRYTLKLEFATPGGTETVTNRVLAGNLMAIGLGGREVTGGDTGTGTAARILADLARAYLDRWNASDEELANLFRVVPVRPTVSACLVMSDIDVDYAGGDPLYPLTFAWQGILIDADLRATAPVGVERNAAEVNFLLLSGLEGSILENRVFEDRLSIPAASTAKVIGLAPTQGLTVHDLRRENVDEILPTLPFDATVKAEIRDAAYRGMLARVPSGNVTLLDWTGVGYLLLDEAAGEAAYQLQGGHSGGVTAPAAINIPEDVRDPLMDQGEDIPPAPEGAEVASVRKFISTDYQEGIVNRALARPFRVLVADAEGQPVPNAPVVFTVMGGGGQLVDPATGLPSQGEVVALSNDRGEAEATLILGQRTDLIPRLLLPEGDNAELQPTQVGLNLVTARAGSATLPEPFTGIGMPDDQFDGTTRWATISWFGQLITGTANLRVAALMGVRVTDPYENPLSNFPIHFTYRPDPVPFEPGEGRSRLRPPNTTPGRVLKPADYTACLATNPAPGWGECPGEAAEVIVRSGPYGANAYAAIGDSYLSLYYFDIGTVTTRNILWVFYGTSGWVCNDPNPAACAGWSEKPLEPWVTSGTRPIRINRLGNYVEAYPPGAQGDVTLWAESFTEKERVEAYQDEQGATHYRAIGINQYRRERLTDSEFDLAPTTAGTLVNPSTATPRPDGTYGAQMQMAPPPQQNTIRYEGRHFPLRIPYLPSNPSEVDPAYVDPTALTVTRIQDRARPYQGTGTFSLWGVSAAITALEPTPVLVGGSGAVSRASTVTHQIQPEAYRQLLAPGDVLFQLKRDNQTVFAANGTDAFVIPQGLAFPTGNYTGQVSVLKVSAGPSDIDSLPYPIAACQLLNLQKTEVKIFLTRDPVNNVTCGEEGQVEFLLCQDATVTLTVDGNVVTGGVDGSGIPQQIQDLPLAAGIHSVSLQPTILGPTFEADARAPFRIAATAQADPSLLQEADGTVVNVVRNRPVTPAGRRFVKGVDLLDGHMVRGATDLELPGRHLGLKVERTYSSTGRSGDGEMGAGWAWSYGAVLMPSECGLVVVTTPNGESQVFRTTDGGNTFTAQRGYHTRLVRNPDLSYDFFDKSAVRYHFREPADPMRPVGTERRLEYVEEPHGDRIVLTYDLAGRVTRVAEVQPDAAEVRAITVSYVQRAGYDRISQIAIPALGLQVGYTYDDFGNLITVTRSGANLSGQPAAAPRTERYEYSTTVVRDRHQMLAAIDANGNRTEYEYFLETDPFPGESPTFVILDKEEHVKEVREFPAQGIALTTQFQYDKTEALSLRWNTTVRDARGNDTLYVQNGNGSPVEIQEPLGKTTLQEWAEVDILMTRQTDALGRVTDYSHDDRGNLISERITTADFGIVETTYEHEPTFNKLTFKRDAEGRETTYQIDPQTGDVLGQTDAVGNVTVNQYDDRGRLISTTDPRGNVTTYTSFDSFGHPQTATDALGNVTTREYDLRGRLVRQTDTMDRETLTTYDGFDRPVSVRRLSGSPGSDDEVTTTTYFPAGQPQSVTNANGATATFTLDGLNRVVATSTTVPTTATTTAQTLTTAAEYDGNSNKVEETDRRGVTRTLTYNALNRLTRVEITQGLSNQGPNGQIAAFTYDLVGNKTSETDVAGLVTDYVYDGLYRVRLKVLPASGAQGRYYEETIHDRVGNRTSFRDPNGNTTTFAYDNLNRLVSTTNALGQISTITYADPEGSSVNKSEENDLTRGLRTNFAYDDLNRETQRVVRLEGPGSSGEVYTTTTTYDDPAHAFTVTDPRGTPTRTQLDGLDRVVEQAIDPSGLNLLTRTTYAGLSNKKQITDPRGNVTRFDHDGLGRLVRTVDALNQDSRATYDGEGLKLTDTDRRGVVKTFTHDNLGRPRTTTVTPSISGVPWSQQTVYQDLLRRTIEIDARNKQTILDMDGLGRVVTLTDALGNTVVTTWDGVNKTAETDKRGHTTSYQYDALNRLTRTTNPPPFQSETLETTYQGAQNRRIDKDRRNTLKATQLDPLGRVLTVTDSYDPVSQTGVVLETNTYDGANNKVSARDAENKETRFAYDAANRLTARTDGFGAPVAATTTYAYDANGNQTEERDPRAAASGEPFSVQRAYDALNRVTTETDGEGNVLTHGFDPEGNETLLREPEDQETTYAYDELAKLLTVTQPGNLLTSHAYDPSRNRISQTDANGHVVAMLYDDLNRLVTMTQDPGGLGLTTTHEYDANGNETKLTDPKGQTVGSTYDELNRLTRKVFAFAPDDSSRPWRHTTEVTNVYDPNGNLIRTDERDMTASGTDPPLRITGREYDALGRLTSETTTQTDGTTRTITYTYLANGLKRSVTDPAGTTTYSYDARNRLATATTSAGVTTYEYWPDSLVKTVTEPNGSRVNHAYDRADRLTRRVTDRGGQVVTAYLYTYSPNGNRLTQQETNGGTTETTTYTYDNLNRLATVTDPPDASHPNGQKTTYGYDGAGNRTSEVTTDPVTQQVLASKTGLFDNANRLTRLTDNLDATKTISFTWHPTSNMASQTVNGVTTNYRYDVKNELVEAEKQGQILLRAAYDSEGRRILKIGEPTVPGGSTTQHFVYDGTSLLAEYSNTGQQMTRYEWGSDRLISLLTPTAGTRQYFHFDGLGSVTALTDDAGAVAGRYHLNVWGELKDPTEVQASSNRLLFTSHYLDTETDFYFARSRFYWPAVGRFITQDTFPPKLDEPPSLNLFAYANQNPLRYVDPTGHSPEEANAIDRVTLEAVQRSLQEDFAAAQQRRLAAQSQPDSEIPEGTIKEEGWLDKILRKAGELRAKFGRWGRDTGEAATRDLITPDERVTAAHERAQRSALDYDPHVNIAARSREVLTDIGREGGARAGETAFDVLAAKGVEIGAAGALGAAGRSRQALRNLAKEADEVVEAEVRTGAHLAKAAEAYARNAELAQARAIVSGRRSELGTVGRIMTDEEARAVVSAAEGAAGRGTTAAAQQTLGRPPSSRVLGQNIETSSVARPPNSAAHHMVAGADPRAAQARAVLAREGVDINDAANGVFLPRSTSLAKPPTLTHSQIHTDRYYQALTQELRQAQAGTVRDVLADIRQRIQDGTFPR